MDSFCVIGVRILVGILIGVEAREMATEKTDMSSNVTQIAGRNK